MFWTVGVGRDVGQVDFRLLGGRKLDLGLFGSFFQALKGQHVLLQVDTLVLLEFVTQIIHQALIKILTAQESITVGAQDFELMLAVHRSDFNDRYVKSTAAQVIHGDFAIAFLFVHAECQCGRGRLVDNALDVEPRNTTRILGGLALAVVEVSWYRNDRLGHFFAEIVFRRLLHFAQYFARYLGWCHLLALRFDPGVTVVVFQDFVRHQADIFLHFFFFKATTDQALDRKQRVLWIGNRLALGRSTNHNFAIILIGDDGRRGARAFRIFDYFGHATFHDGHAAISGSQINTDDFSHNDSPDFRVSRFKRVE